MSGGTFDYDQYKLEDIISDIEATLADNGKTIQQLFDEKPKKEKDWYHQWYLSRDDDWSNRLWETTSGHCPYWVEEEAMNKADKALGIDRYDTRKFNDLSQKEKDKWNKIRRDELKKLVDEHNNSCPGSDYSPEVVALIRDEALPVIRKALVYLNRIDYLFAGDDGEDSFLKRTKQEIKKLERKEKR